MTTSVKASLGYLMESEEWDYVKPFEIKGRRAPGQPRDNIKLTVHDIEITDVRSLKWTPTIGTCGFQWVHHTSSESLGNRDSIASYIEEMEEFMKTLLQADFITTLEYMIRKRIMDPDDPTIRPPSNFVHVDVSPEGAEKRLLHRHPEASQRLFEQRYRYLSIWRPLFGPVKDYPLAVCDSRTVSEDDLIPTDTVYPDIASESYCTTYDKAHRWFYMGNQEAHDVLIITNYDSKTGIRAPHCGFELLHLGPENRKPRESIELKMAVFTEKER